MSRDWTTEELQKASEIMKANGHMGYEEFCEELDEQQAKAALERFAKVQTPRITCPPLWEADNQRTSPHERTQPVC